MAEYLSGGVSDMRINKKLTIALAVFAMLGLTKIQPNTRVQAAKSNKVVVQSKAKSTTKKATSVKKNTKKAKKTVHKSKKYNSKAMRKYVQKVLAKNHARGTVVVIKDGHVQQISYGYGNVRNKIGAGRKQLVYPLGSLQKVVTGAIITQLIYQKKFNQNTKISKWYPHLKNAKHITVGNLMTHTSGINVQGTESNHYRYFSENGAINWVQRLDKTQKRHKRNRFTYNNVNFILLAGIIRKVTHKSYATNVRNRIVKPLHLKQTFVYSQIPRSKQVAYSYQYRWGRDYQDPLTVNRYVVSQLPGAGNLFSTAADYRKIIAGLSNGKILTKKQYKYMTYMKAKKTSYSGGVYYRRGYRGHHLQLAYGNFGGTHFSNWMQITDDNKNGICIFLNQTKRGSKVAKSIGYQILKHVKAHTFVRG